MFLEKKEHLHYKYHIFCCTNRKNSPKSDCCASKGSEDLAKYMKDKIKSLGIEGVRVNKAGCLGRCKLGKVMVIYPEGLWYHYDTQEDINRIIEAHFFNKNIVKDLALPNAQDEKGL